MKFRKENVFMASFFDEGLKHNLYFHYCPAELQQLPRCHSFFIFDMGRWLGSESGGLIYSSGSACNSGNCRLDVENWGFLL